MAKAEVVAEAVAEVVAEAVAEAVVMEEAMVAMKGLANPAPRRAIAMSIQYAVILNQAMAPSVPQESACAVAIVRKVPVTVAHRVFFVRRRMAAPPSIRTTIASKGFFLLETKVKKNSAHTVENAKVAAAATTISDSVSTILVGGVVVT